MNEKKKKKEEEEEIGVLHYVAQNEQYGLLCMQCALFAVSRNDT